MAGDANTPNTHARRQIKALIRFYERRGWFAATTSTLRVRS